MHAQFMYFMQLIWKLLSRMKCDHKMRFLSSSLLIFINFPLSFVFFYDGMFASDVYEKLETFWGQKKFNFLRIFNFTSILTQFLPPPLDFSLHWQVTVLMNLLLTAPQLPTFLPIKHWTSLPLNSQLHSFVALFSF